jgi:hypothetical protein
MHEMKWIFMLVLIIHNVYSVGCTRWKVVEAQDRSSPKWQFVYQAAIKSFQSETKSTDDYTDQILYWQVGALACYLYGRH